MPWPVVTGHELLGEVVRVGSKVTHVKVGDIAGVGCALSLSLSLGAVALALGATTEAASSGSTR